MHAHAHAHTHPHAPAPRSRAFAVGVALNAAFIVAEVVFGLRARSLALIADAGHNLSDVLGLGLAWAAVMVSQWPPTERHTYGLRRASILAALANAILLLVAVGGIAWEALKRLGSAQPVASEVVVTVAACGVLVNGVTALLFVSGRKQDINVRGAFVHMAGDAAVSLGVVIAGLLMARTGWLWLDPAISLAIALVIVWATWGLLRESLHLAMDAVPSGVDLTAVESFLRDVPGVTDLHDLHVWGMSTTDVALTVHLVCPDGLTDRSMAHACDQLRQHFGIGHTTLQVERGDHAPCAQAPADVV